MKKITIFLLAFLLPIVSISLLGQSKYGCKTSEKNEFNKSTNKSCSLTCEEISKCYTADYKLVFHFIGDQNGDNFTCNAKDPILSTNSMLYVPDFLYYVLNEMNGKMATAVLGTQDPDSKIRFGYLKPGGACTNTFFYKDGESPALLGNALNIIFENDPSNPGIRGWTNYGSNKIHIENILPSFLGGSQNYWSLGRLINHEFGHTRNLKHTFNCSNPCDGIDLVAVDECCGKCWPTDSYSTGCWQCSDDDLMMAYGVQTKMTKCEKLELWCYIINNPAPYQTVTNACSKSPDLVVSAKSLSSNNANCGSQIKAYATVKNIGVSTANSSRLGYYLSTNTTLDASDYAFPTDFVGSLIPGGSSPENQVLNLPSNLSSGTYYILFVADVNDDVAESNENNNMEYASISINCGIPDLIITKKSVSANTVSCGGSITANAIVRNIGSAAANPSRLGYYLSTNTTLDAADYAFQTDPVGSLAPGGISNESQVLNLPSNLGSGTYYILFVADAAFDVAESNENNNITYRAISVTCGGSPDLIISAKSVSTNAVSCGGSISAFATVRNIGNTTANPSGLGYYLSTNTTLEAGDIPFTLDPVGSLAPGATSNENQTLTIPTNLSSGTYYILFVADVAYDVAESNENNNIAYKAVTITCGSPDLIISSKSVSHNTVSCGGSITAYATVKNIGNATANPSGLGYYLSTNTTLEAGDIPFTLDPVGSLAPGATSNENQTLTIPTNLSSGTYYILFVADVAYDVAESNENNNLAYKAITVTCGSPDLIISSKSVSSNTVSCGGSITAYATVKNIGNATANPSGLGYYLSTNTTLEAGDIPFTLDPVGSLAPGATSNENQTLTIPTNLSSGTYYILFIADVAYDVAESNENNNIAYKAIEICCAFGNCTPFNLDIQGNANYSNTITSGISATVTFSLQAYSVPDQLIVAVNGVEQINVVPGSHSCIGNPSTLGGTINIEPCDEVEISVIGDVCQLNNTLWHLTSACNGNLQAEDPVETAKATALEKSMIASSKRIAPNKFKTLTVFPNPVQDILSIVVTDKDTNYESVRLLNSSGKIVLTKNVSGTTEFQIDTADLPQGTYLLEIIDDAKNKMVKKIVKME